ncbi:MAG: ABC transporter ATP-binding protein, partial [Oscillospiraceae bacterium]|nr:ABC transporter ATP-binding protein [Oscillospiraceae bacterium]
MDYILECKALTKRYSNKTALDAVDLKLEPGHIVGLLGPNGSGKTTLIKLANGLLTPSSGEIRIDGQKPCAQTKAIVSYLPERNAMPEWMSVEQAIDFYADFYADFRRDAANEMVAQLGLEPKQRIKAMSKGTKEKLQLILIMSRKAKLYLLDEPIGGVD